MMVGLAGVGPGGGFPIIVRNGWVQSGSCQTSPMHPKAASPGQPGSVTLRSAVVVRVEQSELPAFMNHVNGVIDVEADCFRRAGTAGA